MQLSRSGSALKVGYVVKKYPRLSETFIVDEILGLEELGVDVAIHSLLPPSDGRFHADLGRVKGTVTYLPSVGSEGVLEAFTSLRALGPGAASGALDKALSFLKLVPSEHRASLLIQAIRLADIASKNDFDHVHAHFMSLPAQTAYLAHLFSGVGFSVTAHAKDIYLRSVNREVFTQIAEAATAVVTVCEANRQHISRRVLRRPARVDVIYNSVSQDSGLTDGGPRDPRLLLAVGRLVEKKGFDVLLDACRILHERGRDFECVIAGDGEERERLREQHERLGLQGRVRMLGSASRAEVFQLMSRARALVAPCRTAPDGNQDALPTVLLEALAAGLPIVSTPVGGIPEIVDDGVEGLLVPERDAAALADAIDRVLSDDRLWAGMAPAGPAKAAQRFHRSKNLPRLIDIFRRSDTGGRALEAVR